MQLHADLREQQAYLEVELLTFPLVALGHLQPPSWEEKTGMSRGP